MLRAFLGGSRSRARGLSASEWQVLRSQYRRMVQAIRFGDLSEAGLAFENIRIEQSKRHVLSLDAQLAFEALGEAIESGSLADATDGLRLFRLVLEASRRTHRDGHDASPYADEDRPLETLRSGIVPAMTSSVEEELPETATVFDANMTG